MSLELNDPAVLDNASFGSGTTITTCGIVQATNFSGGNQPIATDNFYAGPSCVTLITFHDNGDGWIPPPPPIGGGGGGSNGGTETTSTDCTGSTWCDPNGQISNGIEPCGDCGLPPIVQLYDEETDANGFYLSRIAELNSILENNPFALAPCDSLNIMPLDPMNFGEMWKAVANFNLPISVKNRIDSINNIFISGSETPPFPMYQQTLDAASGAMINCDFFPVNITSLPNGYTAKELLEYFRLNIDYFAQPSVNFTPYIYQAGAFGNVINDAVKFNAPYEESIGALIHIDILGNDGSVIISDYKNYSMPSFSHESHQFKFSTLHTPLDYSHPVGGTRAFGIYNSTSNPNQYTFYTMGVDRAWDWMDAIFETEIFDGSDNLWSNMQSNFISFINSLPGGSASIFSRSHIIARPFYEQVDKYLKGKITFQQLKTILGC